MKGLFYTLILLIFLMFGNTLYAQELLPINKSEFVQKIPERKIAYSKIKEANKLYAKGLGYVGKCLDLLLEAYDTNSESPQLNYNIGICYLINGPKDKALSYMLKADSLQANLRSDVHFFIGLAYQYQNKFGEAIVQFKMNQELIQQSNESISKELMNLCNKHIDECRNGKIFIKQIGAEKIELLSGNVNTKYDEFNPFVFSGNFYFSSRRGIESQDQRSVQDNKFYEKIYKAKLTDGVLGKSIALNTKFDKKSNVALLSKYLNNQFVVYADNSGNGNLFYADKRNDKWRYFKPVSFINEKSSRESSASFTDDGKEVYFVSNRKGGFGECDIYFSSRDDEGKWSRPMNIGAEINTEYDEGDVFVTSDGKELYFSSKGHNSMGGYDIFKCNREENNRWGKPENLGFPINSTDNDITFFKDKLGVFYFASERSGGLGGFDIYRQKQKTEPLVVNEEKPVEKKTTASVEKKMITPIATIVIDPPSKLIEKPEKQELALEAFVYRVQIAASHKEMGTVELFKRYKGGDVIEHLFVGGWHRYTIGGFNTYEEAAKYKDSCGVPDAFVVLFKGDYRIGFTHRTGAVK
ncbi:PD40 domain-containing protein [Ancylomarina longa]|uniref:Uncharacterized protein n=1 Tax=Ancylomarina longa TaxID=2487017 RepID=A0A434AYE1_9BACT|nr:PD40 domain-containing protein [Ancylomarina longa]RUT79578.1 hypothetical protein DLK05_02485 [Ancylomarina longa]